jgi:uncharacterized protein
MEKLVLSHKFCADGLASAWVLRKKYPKAEIQFMQYGGTLPDLVDRDVIMVDWSVKSEQMKEIIEKSRSVLVIDHHDTAEKELIQFINDDRIEIVFDMKKAGCVLAWNYYYPDKKMPYLLSLVQDRDIWSWKLKETKDVSACLASYDLMDIDQFDQNMKRPLKELIDEGKPLNRVADASRKRKLTKDVRYAMCSGYMVAVVNSTENELLHDILNSGLYPEAKFAIGYRDTSSLTVHSFRSIDFDVGQIAKNFSGGGHVHASAASNKLGCHYFTEIKQ